MDEVRAEELRANLERVQQRIHDACERAGRDPDEVTLVAVSKTFPVEDLVVLYEEGVRDFGESYVQEWRDKAPRMPEDVRWHFIGHLQSNKAKYIVDRVHMVHSVDRKSVIKELNRRAEGPVDVLLQVNVAGDEDKSGVDPAATLRLLEQATSRERLRVRGLMTLPPYATVPEDNREHFARLRGLRERALAWVEGQGLGEVASLEHLSMGMTNDFEVAVEEGATLVRVGSGIFGARNYDD